MQKNHRRGWEDNIKTDDKEKRYIWNCNCCALGLLSVAV